MGSRFSLTVFILAATLVVGTKGDKALVQDLCRRTHSYDFCITALENNTHVYVVDRSQLATISTLLTATEVSKTLDKISKIAGKTQDPVEKIRIGVCRLYYEHALQKFREAVDFSSARSYWNVIDRVQNGTNAALECENVYKKYQPVVVCPVSRENHDLNKLCGIILVIVDGLIPNAR